MLKKSMLLFLSLTFVGLLGLTNCGEPANVQAASGKKHKVVIQVSSKNKLIKKIALNNAMNVIKHYGIDNVQVEIVGYGPGLSLLVKSKKNKNRKRVESMVHYGVTFSACGNTIKHLTKKTGKKPKLAKGVKRVPAGVVRIMELQEQGYSYIRP